MNTAKHALILLAALLGGCVVVDDRPRHGYYAASSPPPATAVVVDEDEEVHYVVYREYFGCTDDEIALLPHYRRYYACTDDDLYFCYFVSRRMGISFDLCFRTYYYDCGRSCDRLIVHYRVPREHFFVAVGPGVAYPSVYARPYSCYHSGSYTSVTFSNQEYVALVHMRVGVEYQGHTTAAYFSRVNECNGNTTRVIVKSRDNCGRGGSTVTGVTVQKTAPRPWTMAPEQKHTWQQAHQSQAAKSENSFKEGHKEQVQKVQRQAPSKAEEHPAGRPGTPPSKGPAAAERTPPGHDDRGREKGPGDSPPKGGPPDRGPKPPDRREDAPPPKPPPKDSPPAPPQEKKGGNEDKGRDKDKKKDNRSDRSEKDRRPGKN